MALETEEWVLPLGIGAAVAAVAVIGYYIWAGMAHGTTPSNLSFTIVSENIAQGSNEQVDITGATPNGQVQVSIVTNTGVDLVLGPNPVANANGSVDDSFLIGTNVPTGTNTIVVTDLASGISAQHDFTVT